LPGVTGQVIDFADVDGDGRMDLVGAGVTVYRGLGGGAFATPGLSLEGGWRGLTLGDFDEDGRMDIATPSGSLHVHLLLDRSATCGAGNVDRANGPSAVALTVNGSTGDTQRIVRAARGASVQFALAAATSGPGTGRYVLWAWPGCTGNPVTLSA